MIGKEKIEQRKIVPVVAMISAGKSKLLNVLYNIDYLECKAGIGTKFVNFLRYNPKIKKPLFYHLKLEKEDENYNFYKDLEREEIEGGENIAEAIKNINNELRASPQVNYEDLFYMIEIGESQFIKDEEYLLTHDLCDIPGLSEYQKNENQTNKEENEEKKEENEEKKEENEKKKEENEKKKDLSEDFKKLLQKEKDIPSFISLPEEKEEKNIEIEKETEKQQDINEEDIFNELNNNEKNTYLTEIFKIIKNQIDGGIILLSIENYFKEENFKIIAKLQRTLGKDIKNFLIILNKIDLSLNPKIDIENCKSKLIQKFEKFKSFNINSNIFIPLSLIQLQNELLMKTKFEYLMKYHFYKYLSKIKTENETTCGETFINHLINIITANTGKKREDIESKVEEFNDNENIEEINKEIISIINRLKIEFQTNKFILGVSEKDFDTIDENDKLPDEIDEMTEIEKINPSYILKYIYISQKENLLIPPLSSTTKNLLNYFTIGKIEKELDDKKIKEENIIQQTKLNKKVINHLEKLYDKLKGSKILVNDLQNIIEEIKKVTYFLKLYDVILIPFMGQSNAGKSTIINGIIGNNILPTAQDECTKRGVIIKYWDKDETKISKACFKKEKFLNKTYYYFEEENDIAKGENQVRQTLKGLNKDFNRKVEDSFYFIRTRIKLFDDLKFNDYYKNMIYLIDFPGFGTGKDNIFDKKEIYQKTMNICNSFIFVVKNSIIKEKENQRILNEIFINAKEQKEQLSNLFIKSCLFILNNDETQSTGREDIEIAKKEISDIIPGIKKEDIKLCFFNAKSYSNYCEIYKYFFNLNKTFETEHSNFSLYKEELYYNPGKNKSYKSFYEYLYKKIMKKIKSEKICDEKGVSKNQNINKNCLKEISEIVKKEPFIKDNNFNKYQKFIAQEITFGQENLNKLEVFKNSNIDKFKEIFLSQTNYINNEIQNDIKKKIDEITSILDLFFTENKEGDSQSIDKFNKEIKDIENKMNILLEESNKRIKSIKEIFKTKIKKALKEKINNLKKLLESQNYKEILKEINEEIKKSANEIKNKLDNYINLNDENSQILLDNTKKILVKFSFESIKNLRTISFSQYFSENIGDKDRILIEQIYEEIVNSTESLGNILLQKGIFSWLQSLFSNYEYLWNIVYMLINTYIKKLNIIFDLLEGKYKSYIDEVKKQINIIAKVSIRSFNKSQLIIFNELKNFYEKERNEINKIKLNIEQNK